jgi:hypothetical protein
MKIIESVIAHVLFYLESDEHGTCVYVKRHHYEPFGYLAKSPTGHLFMSEKKYLFTTFEEAEAAVNQLEIILVHKSKLGKNSRGFSMPWIWRPAPQLVASLVCFTDLISSVFKC